ncbi:MAG: peptidase M1 [Flavobacteriales bacterium]|nr:MAG: peptidase M1 [Flavobacteriales bacterium]
MNKILFFFVLLSYFFTYTQNSSYWQQKAEYFMEIDMDVKTYQYSGKQKIVYTNNSPDTLSVVFYHLFFNAFQPNSEMDIRLQNIKDPDDRMVNNTGTREKPVLESRISKLKADEIGYIKVNSLKQDNVIINFTEYGTVLKATLNQPLLPGASTTLAMDFTGQVPLLIRRAGRNSSEGVALSMAQWYPKLAEYDFEGWHANAYIAREFHGVWGNFDVKITIDKDYVIGGSGYLQNPNEIGHGYETGKVNRPKGDKLTWHFKAPNVHDFIWAADPDYIHDKITGENDVTLHFFYKKSLKKEYLENWKKLQPKTTELLAFFNKNIGAYPYEQYSVIQGGDGGMEYAMCTLISGERSFGSLVGLTAHEFAHSWFQFVLATNEQKHEWMDEGFTSYISDLAMDKIMQKEQKNPWLSSYQGYQYLAKSGLEEPQTLHADRYEYNFAYGASAYNKGTVFLTQLGYIIGQDNLQKTLKRYYTDFKFKHPTPNDFIRVAEKVSGLQLWWYLNYWIQTTATIDYAVKEASGNTIILERIGKMPMPIELKVTYSDNSTENFYIPLQMMYGKKETEATVLKNWSWTSPTYTFKTKKTIKNIEIDPSGLLADINRDNNTLR